VQAGAVVAIPVVKSLKWQQLTSSEQPAPMSKPRDCDTNDVIVINTRNIMNRMKSLGWFDIQYTMLP